MCIFKLSKSINVRSICVTKLATKLRFTNINIIHQQNSPDGAEQIDQNDVNHQNNSQGNTKQTNHGNSMTNKQSDLFNVALWNAQSVGNKIPTVNDYLNEHDLGTCILLLNLGYLIKIKRRLGIL